MASVAGGFPFKNVYHLRRVAETAQSPCMICYKPTSAVLVSEDGKNDFFYICQAHLTDSGFATPVINAAAEAAKRKKEELEKEIEKLKQEWDLKQKRKKKEKSSSKEDDNKEDDKIKEKKEKFEHKEQMEILEKQKEDQNKKSEQEQRIFNLNKAVYQMRVNNWKNIQRSKRTQELLRKPGGLPSVPMTNPGSNDSSTSGNI
ncbi:VPS4-associated protein 1 [Dipodascopsis uninucleata]